MTSDDIARLIEAGLPDAQVAVNGDDGAHFEAVVISEEFAGKRAVQRHQQVYGTLGERMGREIHALSLKVFTPEEWAQSGHG